MLSVNTVSESLEESAAAYTKATAKKCILEKVNVKTGEEAESNVLQVDDTHTGSWPHILLSHVSVAERAKHCHASSPSSDAVQVIRVWEDCAVVEGKGSRAAETQRHGIHRRRHATVTSR